MVDTIRDTGPSPKAYQGFGITEYDLKSIRESKGLTLKDIFERTRISVANLTAIENGEFQLLPAPVFTKSFIKIYAKTLGIDSNAILSRYEKYLETLTPTHRDVKIKEIPKSTKLLYKAFLWGLLIIIIVGIVTFSLSSYETAVDVVKNQISEQETKSFSSKTTDDIGQIPESGAQDQTNVITKTQEGDAQPIPLSQAQPAPRETQEGEKTKQVIASGEINKNQGNTAETYKMTMEARDETWLKITADNNQPYEILLQPGEKIEREASRFIVVVGNAGGIDITFQGKPLGNLGKVGEVVHLTLP
ncbi:MAG: helix-turn-helix domain-containing protein [Syntrophales bacterium]|jgi:cytoskeleton protein RodZ